ncbi:MAG: 16S rRNA (guanine(966)-N(2))-methyltransferase RsmD [Lachnospiraceae bacterium]|nr:16S rRNA (guanine(966)-N(2))-methyltransferase RsmD [Lachnospiraceae bacterium]
MRVIAGTARSLRLSTPKGAKTRPTADRIKETLFNMINPYLPGSLVLDLFAGSGGLGIEALSRGADFAYFIENDPQACKCITDNLNFTKMNGQAALINRDALNGIEYLSTLSELKDKYFDLVFIDPPYQIALAGKKVLDLLARQKYINSSTLIIFEMENKADGAISHCGLDPQSAQFTVEKEKIYKTNKHVFLRLTTREVQNEQHGKNE